MKNLFLSLLMVLSVCFLGCSTDITQEFNKGREVIEIQGLKVVLKEGVPPRALDYTLDDYKLLITTKTRAISSIDSSFSNLSLEKLSEYIVVVDSTNNYPDFSAMSDAEKNKTITIIKSDFPELNEEDINKNIDTIIEIYEQQQRYELFNLLESESNSRAILDSFYDSYNLTSEEFWLLFWNATKILGTKKATEQATSYQQNKFPTMSGYNTYSDAFRHSLWNALICIHVGGTKTARLNWAEKFTTLHETSSDSYDINSLETNMDLHNNEIGRSWYDKNSTQTNNWIFYSVTSPSEEQAVNAMYTLAKNSVYSTSLVTIKNSLNKLVHIAK